MEKKRTRQLRQLLSLILKTAHFNLAIFPLEGQSQGGARLLGFPRPALLFPADASARSRQDEVSLGLRAACCRFGIRSLLRCRQARHSGESGIFSRTTPAPPNSQQAARIPKPPEKSHLHAMAPHPEKWHFHLSDCVARPLRVAPETRKTRKIP